MKPFKTYDEQLEIIKSRNLLPDCDLEFLLNYINYPALLKILAQMKDTAEPNLSFSLPDSVSEKEREKFLLELRKFVISHSTNDVKDILKTDGYYNVINLYNKPFLTAPDQYKEGIDFFTLYSFHQIDRRIKSVIFYPILQCEEVLKTTIAYEFAKKYGPHTDAVVDDNYKEPYLQSKNYQNGAEQLIDNFSTLFNGNTPSFVHYRKNHGHIPIWVFINRLMLGDICQFYKKLKIQSLIAENFALTPSQLRTMMETLRVIRNVCAHSGSFINKDDLPLMKNGIPLILDFCSRFKISQKHLLRNNILLLFIIFKYLLPASIFSSVAKEFSTMIFRYLDHAPVPLANDFIYNRFNIFSESDFNRKVEYIARYDVFH